MLTFQGMVMKSWPSCWIPAIAEARQTFLAVSVAALWKRYAEECLVPSAVRLDTTLQARYSEPRTADDDDSHKGNDDRPGLKTVMFNQTLKLGLKN